jgi:hypothetical protein
MSNSLMLRFTTVLSRCFDAADYRSGFGFHSRVNFCASAICARVMSASCALANNFRGYSLNNVGQSCIA